MTDEARVISNEVQAARMADRLGFNEPSGLDLVAGQHFQDDDALLDAAVKAEMERSTPEYKQIRRRLAAELEAQREKERQQQYSADFEAALKSVSLSSFEQREIDTEARQMAQRDFSAGRISSAEMSSKAAEYAKSLTEKAKRTKATNAAFNSMLRGSV